MSAPFSFFFVVAFADAGGGADGRGTDDSDTGPDSGMGSSKN